MKLIFLYGPPAAGKLTVGRALQQRTGLRLFHNHLVVDTLLSVFPFGSPSFVKLREQTWLSVFDAAARDGISLIFTFAPEATVNPSFIESAISTVQKAGGEICFVELTCPIDVIEQRMENPSRAQFLKLRSVEFFRESRSKGAYCFPKFPADLTLDTSTVEPPEAARRICEHFQLDILTATPDAHHDPRA
ncbi:AAA family ATPase [Edaphobacter albus]|uniref:AAA family ATPase n=1 Tax=Edaphobacter sp. 4G125 TaxID=2763071 RepID=UPI00164908EB|nr:AAA family ATPase [Edaphobacter sp. 4G125]QNI37143.1 AAA family ATPase [Edaphobacter sp. 4G125]